MLFTTGDRKRVVAKAAEARDHLPAPAHGAAHPVAPRTACDQTIPLTAAHIVAPEGKCPGRPTIEPTMRVVGRIRSTKVQAGALIGPRGVVAGRVTWCVSIPERLRGVLGRGPLTPDEAYVIAGSRQVHTVGVPYALDAIFCDRRLQVLHVETLQPRTKSKRIAGSQYCIELLGGRAAQNGITAGDQLRFGEPT